MSATDPLRQLPSVHQVLERLAGSTSAFPHAVVATHIRRLLDADRDALRHGRTPPAEASLDARVLASLAALDSPSLRRVINATGVVLHTNLGRAPLARLSPPPGYCNLEYDLEAGRRGRRDTHIAPLLEQLTGAPAIAVNNNAAAIYLALNELASGGEAVISRGELIEIGDGFRIPDIIRSSGAILREVGTTNRTHLDDYRDAISDRTRVILRVHPSNFRIQGFTARPEVSQLCALARERNVPLYEDLGSGCLVDLRPFGVHEPLVSTSLAAGVDLVSFSGDKLLGGPQAGLLAGRGELITRLRRNPMFRALRIDKLIAHALETTLRHILLERWDQVPTLAMIRQPAAVVRARAEALLARAPRMAAAIIEGESVIGGGATPEQSIPTSLIALAPPDPVAAERALRRNAPPVIARIENDRVLLDLRTVLPEEEDELLAAMLALPGPE